MSILDLEQSEKLRLLSIVEQRIQEFYTALPRIAVAPSVQADKVKEYVKSLSLTNSKDPEDVINHITKGLAAYAVHTPHPRYFGLFNPRPAAMSTFGDYITASFNPQMAAWSHAPYANEVERYLIDQLAGFFGYETHDGTFCGGGAESNLTAVQCALVKACPQVSKSGLMGVEKRPMIYVSAESHHSILKAARIVGLGSDSVNSIPVKEDLKMDLDLLESSIRKDKEEGRLPMMVVATAGTTGTGTIDPIEKVVELKKKYNFWLHVDGAWGAAIIISDTWKHLISGIEQSDSVTMDFHKWFSNPMGGSVFVTSDPEILFQAYHIKTAYMPPDGDQSEQVDPYLHSIQWSRRFIGLKAYISVACHGWEGYAEVVEKDIDLCKELKSKLEEDGWVVTNDTDLPVLCLTHPSLDDEQIQVCINDVIESGKAWLSLYPVHGRSTIRVCITNHATTTVEVDQLVSILKEAAKLS